MDSFCGRLDELPVFRSADSMLPAPVRFIPDLEPCDPPFVAAHRFGDIPVPCLFLFFVPDRRIPHSTECFRRVPVVNSVSVAEAEPRHEPAPEEIVHHAVQPRKIIDSLLLFRACPAGLDANPFDAKRRYFVVGLFRIEDRTVQFFKTQPERRGSDL